MTAWKLVSVVWTKRPDVFAIYAGFVNTFLIQWYYYNVQPKLFPDRMLTVWCNATHSEPGYHIYIAVHTLYTMLLELGKSNLAITSTNFIMDGDIHDYVLTAFND